MVYFSVADPHWLYADPKNLVNADPAPDKNKIRIKSEHLCLGDLSE